LNDGVFVNNLIVGIPYGICFFKTSTGQGNVFAFDDMTVGALDQVVEPTAVPEPSIIVLLSVGLAGIGLTSRRFRKTA
jgi:hypothetical protein